MKIRSVTLVILCFVVALAACTKSESDALMDSVNRSKDEEEAFLKYITKNNIDSVMRDPSGMFYRIVREGSGTGIKLTSVPTIIFTTQLPSGKVVQSSLGVPSNLDGRKLNAHIPGWQVGIPRIKRGGRIILFIPSSMAYGSAGVDNLIPPNTPLISEIDLVDFTD